MGIREMMGGQNKRVQLAVAGGLILVAGSLLAAQFWPQKRANLDQAYYTDDDGQSWFADSAFAVPPFDHNGKPAVAAQVYTYDGGKKKFCAYEVKYTDAAKAKLSAAIAAAKANGQPPGSVELLHDPAFRNAGLLVKKPGAGNPWVPRSDPKASDVCAVQSPDGTPADDSFVY